ncbi:hypothetical protein [Amycolatopsis magusensis]|uniref:hypothetical protein n=1 Tax=Amycolatopsis magusensis TaxID=882444 RepID=UPI0037B9168D
MSRRRTPPGPGRTEPLPSGPGLFYRFHHRAATWGRVHASSTPLHGDEPARPGYSCLPDPHSLARYLHDMD